MIDTKVNSQYIKNMAKELGAVLCYIASIDRFNESPKGFHPLDVMDQCKSVIVLSCNICRKVCPNSVLPPCS